MYANRPPADTELGEPAPGSAAPFATGSTSTSTPGAASNRTSWPRRWKVPMSSGPLDPSTTRLLSDAVPIVFGALGKPVQTRQRQPAVELLEIGSSLGAPGVDLGEMSARFQAQILESVGRLRGRSRGARDRGQSEQQRAQSHWRPAKYHGTCRIAGILHGSDYSLAARRMARAGEPGCDSRHKTIEPAPGATRRRLVGRGALKSFVVSVGSEPLAEHLGNHLGQLVGTPSNFVVAEQIHHQQPDERRAQSPCSEPRIHVAHAATQAQRFE